MASACGARIVEMIREDLRPSRILDRQASTTASSPIWRWWLDQCGSPSRRHGPRAGVALTLDDMAGDGGAQVPVCANVFPSGEYLMEDFYFAGGLLALLAEVRPHRQSVTAMTVNGRTLGDNVAGCRLLE